MLMDARQILFDLAASTIGASPYESNSFDLNNIGPETRDDLFCFMMFKTQMDTPTAFSVSMGYADSADLLTNFTLVNGWTFGNTTSTPIPAGTLIQSPLFGRRRIGDITSDIRRYFGIVITYTTTPAADELIMGWIGQSNSIPVGAKELL